MLKMILLNENATRIKVSSQPSYFMAGVKDSLLCRRHLGG
jgi:hypothetical protein